LTTVQGQLFSRDFLFEGIRQFEPWTDLAEEGLLTVRRSLQELFAGYGPETVLNEAATESEIILPVLALLGWTDYLQQQSASRSGRQDVPDVLLFPSEDAKATALQESCESARYRHGLVVLESKRWQRPLDRSQTEDHSDGGMPAAQMLRYLSRVEVISERAIQWGILTNGRRWRLYWQGRIDAEKNSILPITANKERRTLGAALSWGVRNDLLPSNPVRRVPLWKVKKKASVEWFELDEIEAIVSWLFEPYRPIVWWALATGMRLSEILDIRWKDVHTPRLGIVGKGNKVRYLPITDRMKEVLEEVRRGLKKKPDPEDLVWPFQRGAVGAAFARARDQAEVGKGHFRALRDTFAVWYLRNGGSYHILSKILGHSSVLITEKYYAHVPIGDIADEMERVSVLVWQQDKRS
jgi:integrase